MSIPQRRWGPYLIGIDSLISMSKPLQLTNKHLHILQYHIGLSTKGLCTEGMGQILFQFAMLYWVTLRNYPNVAFCAIVIEFAFQKRLLPLLDMTVDILEALRGCKVSEFSVSI